MEFKKTLKIALCIIAFLSIEAKAQQKAAYIILKGQLVGFDNQVELGDMSDFQYLLPPNNQLMISTSANGNFQIKFKATRPNYYRLGRNMLYLSPGDDMKIYINMDDPTLAKFEGTGSQANLYLRNTPFPKAGSFIEGGRNIKASTQATLAAIEEIAKTRAEDLKKTTNVSAEFKRLETARIKADLINSINSGEFYSVYVAKLKDSAAKVFTENYRQATKSALAKYSKNFIDTSLLKIPVYRDIASDLYKYAANPTGVTTIKDYYKASDLVDSMEKVSDKTKLKLFKTEINKIKTLRYKNAANAMLTSRLAFGKGDLAVDFTATDIEGKQVALSTLKGKVIYVDLWATWCGPCMEEMPFFEKLKEKYKDNPNVVFVSLSIDDGHDLWKKSIETRKASGNQWIINRNKLNAYNIVSIPRSLLIDKDFNIVSLQAPMPSQDSASAEIDKLIN